MRKISCGLATSVMSAIALAGAPGEPQLPVFVVIQDHAGVPRHVLARAIQTVMDVYRPLGIGIAWIRAPYPAPNIPTLYLSLLPRTAAEEGRARFSRVFWGDLGARLEVPVFPRVSRLQWRGGRRRDEDDAKHGGWDGNRDGNRRSTSCRGSRRGARDDRSASLHPRSHE